MTEYYNQTIQLHRDIRSILITSPVGMTSKEVAQMYWNFIGHKLDYKCQGYATLSGLLKSLDFVRCDEVQEEDGRYVVRYSLSSFDCEANRKLYELVKKQKVESGKKKSGRYTYAVDRMCPKNPTGLRHVPKYLAESMFAILKNTNTDGLTIEEFLDNFERYYGHRIVPKTIAFKDYDELFYSFVHELKDRIDVSIFTRRGLLTAKKVGNPD
ncbi:hypothetical protein ACOME3_004472 [Neoechinorhynchus agilis]